MLSSLVPFFNWQTKQAAPQLPFESALSRLCEVIGLEENLEAKDQIIFDLQQNLPIPQWKDFCNELLDQALKAEPYIAQCFEKHRITSPTLQNNFRQWIFSEDIDKGKKSATDFLKFTPAKQIQIIEQISLKGQYSYFAVKRIEETTPPAPSQ